MREAFEYQIVIRAPDKARIFIPKMPISWLNLMFDLLLESSDRDDSNKRSNIGFGREIMELASIEVYFTHVIWSSDIQLVSDLLVLRFCCSKQLSSAKFFICFNFQSASMLLKVDENVWVSNSLDLGESASHPDQSCLHIAL